MPVAPVVTYPGVYIQEVTSEIRTIVPVDTATTAFVGRALRGPVNQPVVINAYADFQQLFGGLWQEKSLGHGVNHFFLNGGSKAIVVRLYHSHEPGSLDGAGESGEQPSGQPVSGTAQIEVAGLRLEANNPGAWDGLSSNNAAIFFPRVKQPNRLRNNQVEAFTPSVVVAGVFARTDATRGVWKLGEVNTLALAYGWRETDILAMGEVRRRLYLELIE